MGVTGSSVTTLRVRTTSSRAVFSDLDVRCVVLGVMLVETTLSLRGSLEAGEDRD